MKLRYANSIPERPAAHFNGFCYEADKLLDCADAAKPIAEEANFEGFLRRMTSCNGEFALAIERGQELWAAVSPIRSHPLFYAQNGEEFYLSDDAHWIRKQLGDEKLDPLSLGEFQYMLFVLGDKTLSPSIRQLRAGEAIRVYRQKGNLTYKTHRYYAYVPQTPLNLDLPQQIQRLDEVLLDTFERLVRSVGQRQIVVPLSGGLDSRLLACMLKRLGMTNVFCFTYGHPRSSEVEISRMVAKTLGYPWKFVSYENVDLREEPWNDHRRRFTPYSSNLYTLPPLLEDWIAVGELKSSGLIEENALFCPGHTAAFSSGKRALRRASVTNTIPELAELILQLHSPRMHWKKPSLPLLNHMRNQIETELLELAEFNPDIPLSPEILLEAWNWQERQNKRIINMVRSYEFWGYSWRLPLWDGTIMDLLSRIPSTLRLSKRLFKDYLVSHSKKDFAGLFDPNDSWMGTAKLRANSLPNLASRVLHRLPATRFFFTDKNIECLLTGSYQRYLLHVGRRLFSREPVTGPWLQMEILGCEDVMNSNS